MGAVVTSQMGQIRDVGQVINRHQPHVRIVAGFIECTQHTAAYATVTIDCDAIGHVRLPR